MLCEFRARLITGKAEMRLLDRLLDQCRARGWLKARGRQRTDSTHVIASVRELSRLELIGETLRAALNEVATVAPSWLQGVAPTLWYERYSCRVEDRRLPRVAAERQLYAQTVGEDGVLLLALLDAPAAPPELSKLPQVQALRTAWSRHYECDEPSSTGTSGVHFKTNRAVTQANEQIESPYEPEARYRSKSGMHWTGYRVHFSETCDDESAHLITHVHTTPADVHEALCTDPIQQALADKGLAPHEHLVDAGYVSAELLVQSQTDYGIDLMGPARGNPAWQRQAEGAYTSEHFTIDWAGRVVHCPQGVASAAWRDYVNEAGKSYHLISFPTTACRACGTRALCTKAKQPPRRLHLHPQPQQEALQAARQRLDSAEGRRIYGRRAGVEGTLSQGVRAFGLRQARYCGLAKTHLQQIATAVAMNLERLVAWLTGKPQAVTRISRFAALAPS